MFEPRIPGFVHIQTCYPYRYQGAKLQDEMLKRGVVTRTRATADPHPAPGDMVFFAPPLAITEAEIDRLASVARDASNPC
jgi:adenosylmethionine-8-amino-7-oxononanoate aminotransferase